ncbi:MAG: hypothetical protein ACI8XV_001359, partial [Arenicella sp.]
KLQLRSSSSSSTVNSLLVSVLQLANHPYWRMNYKPLILNSYFPFLPLLDFRVNEHARFS